MSFLHFVIWAKQRNYFESHLGKSFTSFPSFRIFTANLSTLVSSLKELDAGFHTLGEDEKINIKPLPFVNTATVWEEEKICCLPSFLSSSSLSLSLFMCQSCLTLRPHPESRLRPDVHAWIYSPCSHTLLMQCYSVTEFNQERLDFRKLQSECFSSSQCTRLNNHHKNIKHIKHTSTVDIKGHNTQLCFPYFRSHQLLLLWAHGKLYHFSQVGKIYGHFTLNMLLNLCDVLV